MSSKRILNTPFWLLAVWVFALVLTILLAFDAVPLLRGDADWVWAYYPVVSRRLIPVTAGLVAYIALSALVWRWARDSESRARWVVAFAVVAGIAIQVGMQYLTDPNPIRDLVWRTTAPDLGGYYDIAVQVDDVGEFLRDFPQNAPGWNPHPQRHPPGHILTFIGIKTILEHIPGLASWLAGVFALYRCEYWPLLYISDPAFASLIGGLLILPLTAAGVIPLYAIIKATVNRRAGLAAVLLSPLVPGYSLFAGQWDTAFVLITGLLVWFLYQAMARKRRLAWLWAGVLLSVGTFLTHAMLTLCGVVVLYALLKLWQDRSVWRSTLPQLLANSMLFAVGLASLWLVYWAVYGITWLDVWRANTGPHFKETTSYFARLLYNPYDFTLFLGYALGLLALAAIYQTTHAVLRTGRMTEAQTVLLASAVTFTLLVVSGIARAEVGRVWIFMMPLAVFGAVLLEHGPSSSTVRLAVTAALLAVQMLVMNSVLMSERQPRHYYALPPDVVSIGTQVGDSFELAGYSADLSNAVPGGTVSLTLYWRALGDTDQSYTRFAHLYRAGDQDLAGQADALPRNGEYPTTCWLPGEVVKDEVVIPVEIDASGKYELLVGMYSLPEVTRLPTHGPGAAGDVIVLTQVGIKR